MNSRPPVHISPYPKLAGELWPFIRAYWTYLSRAEKWFAKLYETPYAATAWKEYGGDGLPLGLWDMLLSEPNPTVANHLECVGLEQFATKDALRWVITDADDEATYLTARYFGNICLAARNLLIIALRLHSLGQLDHFLLEVVKDQETLFGEQT
ncbi:MAG: hypothetical protein BroJett011_42740 [Chloroflexota bacterium]|nr:MAG: hypothetical protein BroJett011_42740 [Chloroflexota bacterium]